MRQYLHTVMCIYTKFFFVNVYSQRMFLIIRFVNIMYYYYYYYTLILPVPLLHFPFLLNSESSDVSEIQDTVKKIRLIRSK